MNTKRLAPWLVLANLFWSTCSLIYDIPVIATIPPWAWIFVVICPIYPLLMSGVWLTQTRNKAPHPLLLAFASLPSAAYGLLAFTYYPMIMLVVGFSWSAVLQIPWVLFYSIQGWYWLRRGAKPYAYAAALFLAISFTIQYRFQTFGYLDVASFSDGGRIFLWLMALLSGSIALFFAIALKPKY